MKKLVTFGSNGWMPSSSRETMSFAVEVSNSLVLFDLGTGVSRLDSQLGQELLKNYHEIIIFLSHYHMDHIIGLHYLPRFMVNKRVIMAGPGEYYYNLTIEKILEQICRSPYFSLELSSFPFDIQFQELKPGCCTVGGVDVDVTFLSHSAPCLGYKVEDVVYLTDTNTKCNPALTSFCKRSKLMLHEAMYDTLGFSELSSTLKADHSNALDVAQLASNSDVCALVLTHLNPAYSEMRLKNMLSDAQKIFARTTLATDLSIIPLINY